jgi:tRNA A-37 threonylcarbamoyl transferase component Bud32
MKCPACQADIDDSAHTCFHCGRVLKEQKTLIRGSVIAGRYEVLAPLGKGGMGMVYKARDHKLEETVAIKVLRSDMGNDADMERRFRTEIRLARKVRHRNVCGIHEYGEEGGLRYIAMEFIEGVDLRKVLNEKGALAPAEAIDVAIHVAEGLQAIHEAGIVHRDLKTANLMRDAGGVVRLMDFGIAKQVGQEATLGATATGLVVGTPEYMSPEQARGGKIDNRSDVYALGIVAFELFTGRVPFRGETPIATIFKHLQEPPPLEGPEAAAIPPAVVPVLRQALAKSPEERFASAAEFAMAMVQARDAAGIPVPAGAPGTPRPGTGAFTATTPRPTVLATAATGTGPMAETRVAQTRVAQTRVVAPPSRKGLPVAALLGGLALVGALGIGGALLVLRGRSAAPAASPVAAATQPGAPSATPPRTGVGGTVIIDALPWGEVSAVTDARGEHHEPAAGRYTPLALELPPGEYRIEVKNPAFPNALEARVSIVAGGTQSRLLEFRRVDAADYFRRNGS